MELLMDASYLRRDGDVKWGAFLRSLNTCFKRICRISPEELHNLILIVALEKVKILHDFPIVAYKL